MCGIAGFSGDFGRDLLVRMGTSIAHRGPDDDGVWLDETHGVGLAHRRLTIIDLSAAGHQPMWDATGTVVISYNGEIFNYRELRAELVRGGFGFRSESDTEVLLNLYLRDGDEMLARLNGMYAFAIWDTRSRALLVARDGPGVKPLYFAETARGFLFASELKALLQDRHLDRTLDVDAIQSYVAYLWCPAPRTILRSVQKLEPGHAMVVREGRILRRWRFYDLPYTAELDGMTEAEAIAGVEHFVQQAVRRQMVADVPVGAFLSGGLDSSSVAAFASATSDEALQCFTIGFGDDTFASEGMIDDLPIARRVARHLGVDLHTVEASSAEMVKHLERMVYHLDEPQADPAALNALFICEMARDHGLKVLLSGAGGDDIFTGYRRHYVLQQERAWAWLPRSGRRALAAAAARVPARTTVGRRLGKALRYADLDGDARIASYFYWIDPGLLHALFDPDVGAGIREPVGGPLLASLGNIADDVAPLNRMLYLEGKHFLADHNLPYTDRMSMACGVEVRVPLLDPDLVEFATRLPLEYKQRGRVGKWAFKKAMEPYLPRDVIYRSKTGFGAPLRRWLGRELRDTVDDILSAQSLAARGIFDHQNVRTLINDDRLGRVDAAYPIFALICLEMWCRAFLDTPA